MPDSDLAHRRARSPGTGCRRSPPPNRKKDETSGRLTDRKPKARFNAGISTHFPLNIGGPIPSPWSGRAGCFAMAYAAAYARLPQWTALVVASVDESSPRSRSATAPILSSIVQGQERAVDSSWHAPVTSASENRELASGRKAHLGPSTELSNAIIATHQHIDFFLALTTLLLSRAAITTRAPTSHRPPSKTSYLASATLRFPGLEATISTSVLC